MLFLAILNEFSLSFSFSFDKALPSDAATASCLLLSVLFIEEGGMLGLMFAAVAISAKDERELVPFFLPNATGGGTRKSEESFLH